MFKWGFCVWFKRYGCIIYSFEHNGIIDSSVKKSTDILIIGSNECQFYSNKKYGTKVKKAIEYNQKGSKIEIIKESDFMFE